MPDREWETWDAQEPPPDFAAQVVGEALAEQRTTRRRRGGRVLAGAVVLATMAAGLVMAFRLHNANARGDVTADSRREVRIGTRALAVLEKGAHVTWNGDAITQGGGDVFWRVEPGARFTVHTAAADVTVKGTCFRVKARGGEDEMNRRDVGAGTVGAALAAAAFVGVYEGKVALSHAGQSVDVAAGEGARADASGVRKTDGGESAEADEDRDDSAWLAANQSLADQVKTYRHRLESVDAQKQKLEKALATAQAKLADAGGVPADDHWSHEPTPDELADLAKKGEIRVRLPCKMGGRAWALDQNNMQKLGIAPQDMPVVNKALAASSKRMWAALEPLCAPLVGGADVAERVGVPACLTIVNDNESRIGNEQYDEDMHRVSEILAGQRPAPGPGDNVDPFERMLLSLTGETKALETDLAQSLGPDEAKRFVYTDEGCWTGQGFGVGPRPE